MLYVHMLLGLLAGLITASLGLVAGGSPWVASCGLVLGCNVGLLLSAAGLHLCGTPKDTRAPLEPF